MDKKKPLPQIQFIARHINTQKEYEIHTISFHGGLVAIKLPPAEIVTMRFRKKGNRSAEVEILAKTEKMPEFKAVEITACQAVKKCS